MKKVILYIAQSLDGYIARENGSIEWLDTVEREGEDYGYHDFYQKIDVCIMGRKTYDTIKNMNPFPYKHLETYVVTKKQFENRENLHFYAGPVYELVSKLKDDEGKNIWLIGGGELIRDFINLDLIDEYIIATLPVLLGRGIPLFREFNKERYLKLKKVKNYESGLVQCYYTRD